MVTLADIERKITIKTKMLTLAIKENERTLSRGKERKLLKQQNFTYCPNSSLAINFCAWD